MKKLLFASIGATLLLTACSKNDEIIDAPGSTTITFDAKVGNADFALNKDFTIGTRTYQFNKLRYWVSNVSLVDNKGVEYAVPNSYFLLEETGNVAVQDGDFTYPANKREAVTLNNIPVGEYKTLKFNIGVDAKYNDNLSMQAGELSQLNGMTNVSWMWHTSYIFTAIGGKVTEGATTKNIVAETGLNANYKSVSINLPTAIKTGSLTPSSIQLSLDIAKVLDGVDLIATPTIGASQATVMSKLATNYTTAFTAVSAK